MSANLYRLPNGGHTRDPDEYVRAWRALTANLKNILGDDWCCSAFDPGLCLTRVHMLPNKVERVIETISVSVYVMQKLNELYLEYQAFKKQMIDERIGSSNR